MKKTSFTWRNHQQSEKPGDEDLDEAEADEEDEYDDDEYADEEDVELIPDPLIGMNRGLFHFNDKLYFWLLKPVARGFGFIIPEELRMCVRNVFYNIRFPVRFINSLLQGKGRKAGAEVGQFFVNSTIGILGDTFLDPIWWVPVDIWTSVAIRAGEATNDVSLRIGEYEALKEAAIDPYVMLRNAYVQNRNKLIAE